MSGTPFDLTGRVAVVTGGAAGIGRATAEVLAGAGGAVVVGDVAATDATVAAIAAAGGKAVGQRCDVSDRAQVDALVDRAVSEFGRLDAMCNVAGIASDGLLAEVGDEEMDRVISINLKGVLYGCQAALRVMIPQGSGSIVNVSSTAVDTPAPKYGMYAITKAGVTMMTKTLAFENGRHGVRVNAIAPGVTISGFTARHIYEPDGSVNQERYDQFVSQMKRLSPLGMVGEPVDQAYLVLYLVSDASRFSTGNVWRANGGQSMV